MVPPGPDTRWIGPLPRHSLYDSTGTALQRLYRGPDSDS